MNPERRRARAKRKAKENRIKRNTGPQGKTVAEITPNPMITKYPALKVFGIGGAALVGLSLVLMLAICIKGCAHEINNHKTSPYWTSIGK